MFIKNISLYIHIPFCEKKCPFCSFAIVVNQSHRISDYLNALEQEVALYRGAKLGTIYIGGGTPSLLGVSDIEHLWIMIENNFSFDAGCEKSFELNPESVTEEKAKILRRIGVNRVSLGVQSMNDRYLGYLGRSHRREDALRSFSILRSAGFDNINLDLMYGFSGQTLDDLREDMDDILNLGSEHLSIYSLAVEERSLFFARKEHPREASAPDFYSVVCKKLNSSGIRQYEISNFARQGFESLHNLNYWRGGEYIGLGMAAHSHLDGKRFWNADTLSEYFRLMREKGMACNGSEKLAPGEKLTETFLFGLRMNAGVDLWELEKMFAAEMAQDKKEELENLIDMGFLEEDGTMIRVTDKGRIVLDEISARLI